MRKIPNKLSRVSVKCLQVLQLLIEQQAFKVIARKLSRDVTSRKQKQKNQLKQSSSGPSPSVRTFPTLTHPGSEVLTAVGTELHLLIFVLSVNNKKDTPVRNTAWIGFNSSNL